MDLNTNTGAIFKNQNKTKDSQPDYRGEIDVNGERKSIALWFKKAKNDKQTPYFSVSIGEPYKKEGASTVSDSEPPF